MASSIRAVSAQLPVPTRILAVDIGGTKIKMLVSGETEPRKLPSGTNVNPTAMVEQILKTTSDWRYDAITIGYPGLVGTAGPIAEPGNLGKGWVGFDFSAAFKKPVKVMNDAAMQALGSYEGGKMLFVGLGTGLGSALIADKLILPLELGNLPFRKGCPLGHALGRAGLNQYGKKKWRILVYEALTQLSHAFVVDYIVVGGGNAKILKEVPPGARLGHNQTAFRGAFRIWGVETVAETLDAASVEWRLL